MSKTGQWAAVALVLVGVLGGAVVLVHNVLTSQLVTTSDFLPRWEGARLFVEEGLSPYSEETSLAIQELFYGRPAEGDEDRVLFAYPFYTVFVVFPLVFVNYAWASAIWIVLLELSLIASFVLLLRLYNWRPGPLLAPLLFLWILLDYPALRGVFLGQPSHVVTFLQVLTVFAVVRGRGGVAGVALAVSTIKPQMGYLFVPALLLWALVAGRKRLLLAFTLTFGGMLTASFLLQPDWFGAWFDQVRLYSQYTSAAYSEIGSPVWIVTRVYLGPPPIAEWIAAGVLALPLLWAWFGVLVQKRHDRWLWAVMLTLAVSHLIGLRTATPHFVIFNIAFVFFFKRLAVHRGSGWAAAAVIGLLLLNWVQFVVTGLGSFPAEPPSMFLTLPFGLYALLLLTRHEWWQHAPTPYKVEARTTPEPTAA